MKLRTTLSLLIVLAVAVLLFLPRDLAAAPLEGLDERCLETSLKDCSVLHSGYFAPEGIPRLAYQTQAGFTDDDGVMGGVVMFEVGPSGDWQPVVTAFDAYRYEAPRLVEHDTAFIHIPGMTGGTGAYNADMLLIWSASETNGDDFAWRWVDIRTWQDSIGPMLPEGLEIWKGIDYDFEDWFWGEMDARTPLWRSDDGNCCPSGGEAIIHFLVEEFTLVATRVDYIEPPKSK